MVNQEIIQHKTRLTNNDGYSASTTFVIGIDAYQVMTYKNHKKKLVSKATKGKYQNGCFSHYIISDQEINLSSSDAARVTKKLILEKHNEAIKAFKEHPQIIDLQSKPFYEIKKGQILFHVDSISSENHHDDLIVFDINDDFYRTINIKTGQFQNIDIITVRNITDKLGIGIYYKENDLYPDLDKLDEQVKIAAEKNEQARILKEQEEAQKAQERQQLIEIGRKLVNIPPEAKAIIVANNRIDQSDSQADYYGHRVTSTIYLAFSTHTRNLFPEFRQAALASPLTEHMADLDASHEHRENYSMGKGMYLSEAWNSGWAIRKTDLSHAGKSFYEDLYIAAAQSRYFCEELTVQVQPESSSETYSNDVFTLSETIHSKKGHNLFVATFIHRVSKDEFKKVLETAKACKGFYSSYNKDGAIPGFQFKTDLDRQQFLNQNVLNN